MPKISKPGIMNYLDELYFLLGYLEGLASKDLVLSSEMDKVEAVVLANPFFKRLQKPVLVIYDKEEYEDDTDPSDWNDEAYEEVGWSFDDMNPSHDPSQNPWIDVFGPGEEAEMAYWNHD
jgi:hypothetical protein